ncbi:adenosine 3'-phospho 5'-phosphosulfate transporter 2 isoform X2 [Hyalella azteca]|uniref:Adenosine 3'-phospho 5'-phosphosulfate transporter 2 n=1 Tax=Hyalella azteca TaxID=294128 RepID=A0A8B7N8Q4_HYAAZ|nr:adenosine 3'-phospho 5'-phosphosulfate transporter 2 isoform X2 [Hyalella azteca]
MAGGRQLDEKSSAVSIRLLDDELDKEKENVPSLLGLPLVQFSTTVRFIICSVAIFIFYVLYGCMLEFVFRVEGLRDHGWFVTLIQFGYYSLFAVMQLAVSRQSVRTNVPLNTYFTIALITVGTMGFSNTSMGYLNYPTQVIFKSCKLIPVMIGSIIILRKTYSFAQVLSCLMMCAGLVWFTLADSQIQPDFNLQGVVLVSMSLCCDAIIGNVQEAALKNSHEPSARVVLYSYGLGFLCILAFLLLTGSLLPGAFFFLEHWWELMPAILVLSASGFCGVQAVLALVTLHGALVAVTVTTARKAISILLSFLLFTKPFTIQYVWGGTLVVLGIYLNLLAKQQHALVTLLNNWYARAASTVRRCCERCTDALLTNKQRGPAGVLLRAWSNASTTCRREAGTDLVV